MGGPSGPEMGDDLCWGGVLGPLAPQDRPWYRRPPRTPWDLLRTPPGPPGAPPGPPQDPFQALPEAPKTTPGPPKTPLGPPYGPPQGALGPLRIHETATPAHAVKDCSTTLPIQQEHGGRITRSTDLAGCPTKPARLGGMREAINKPLMLVPLQWSLTAIFNRFAHSAEPSRLSRETG